MSYRIILQMVIGSTPTRLTIKNKALTNVRALIYLTPIEPICYFGDHAGCVALPFPWLTLVWPLPSALIT